MKVTTGLIFNGQTEAAFTLYKEVFQTEFVSPIVRMKAMMPELDGTPEGERVLYVAINIGDHQLKGNDSPDVPEDFRNQPQAYSLFVEVDSEAEGQRIFNALSENGQVVYPLEVQPWGDYYGHLVDRFGIKWDIKIN
ncbi:TPA: VOC family protein [Streptococcus suis]